jgi:hypothetical protein
VGELRCRQQHMDISLQVDFLTKRAIQTKVMENDEVSWRKGSNFLLLSKTELYGNIAYTHKLFSERVSIL